LSVLGISSIPNLITDTPAVLIVSNSFSALVELDLDITFDGKRNTLIKSEFASIDPHLGVEFAYKDIVFIRGGVGNIQQEVDFGDKKSTTVQPNFGVGIKIKKLVVVDYALTDIGNTSIALYSNIFSVRVNLGKNM